MTCTNVHLSWERHFPSHSMALTSHQRMTLNYIGEFQRKRGYSPSLSDLAVAFGVRSKNAIAKVVTALVRQGKLQKDPKGRIKILEVPQEESTGAAALMLPLFGPVSAGFAAPAEEQVSETLSLERYLIRRPAATFLLRVKGDSMINAGINAGDLAVVERGREPKANDIVVGVLDGEFTLKRLKRDKGKSYLQAENPAYPDLHPLEELTIAGVVVGIIRKYGT